jgi:anti-anti-sigma factor
MTSEDEFMELMTRTAEPINEDPCRDADPQASDGRELTLTVGTEPSAWSETLRQVTEQCGSRAVRLDCRHVQRVASADLGRLITARLRMQAAGGQLSLINVNENLWQVLEITRLTRLFPIGKIDRF